LKEYVFTLDGEEEEKGRSAKMTSPVLILDIIRTYHRGKSRAITRDALRDCLRQMGYKMSDRDLRECYAELPVCSCSAGIFYPETAAELFEFKEYLRAKALSCFVRWNRVAQAHPELIDARQGELFP